MKQDSTQLFETLSDKFLSLTHHLVTLCLMLKEENINKLSQTTGKCIFHIYEK